MDEQVVEAAKKILINANVDASKVSSFISEVNELETAIKPVVSRVQTVSPSELADLLVQ